MTELTVEALTILTEILEKPKFLKMRANDRIDKIIGILEAFQEISLTSDRHGSLRAPGYIIDNIKKMLNENEGVKFTTTQIANELSIPQSTVRAYIRKIVQQEPNYYLIEGKPNSIVFDLSR